MTTTQEVGGGIRDWITENATGPMRQTAIRSPRLALDRPLQLRPDLQTIADAYVYLLGRMLVIRQEHLDLDQVGADYNVITYDPLGNMDLVNPNFDVASLEGMARRWMTVRRPCSRCRKSSIGTTPCRWWTSGAMSLPTSTRARFRRIRTGRSCS